MLNRDFFELVNFLFREDKFPEGVILLTGTCLVPELNFTLQSNDLVYISIENICLLINLVKQKIVN